jgi:hypothetical protein
MIRSCSTRSASAQSGSHVATWLSRLADLKVSCHEKRIVVRSHRRIRVIAQIAITPDSDAGLSRLRDNSNAGRGRRSNPTRSHDEFVDSPYYRILFLSYIYNRHDHHGIRHVQPMLASGPCGSSIALS